MRINTRNAVPKLDDSLTQDQILDLIRDNNFIPVNTIVNEINQKAEFYLNNDKNPVLIIDHMIVNITTSGSIGLFVDIGTEGYFKDLKIKKAGN